MRESDPKKNSGSGLKNALIVGGALTGAALVGNEIASTIEQGQRTPVVERSENFEHLPLSQGYIVDIDQEIVTMDGPNGERYGRPMLVLTLMLDDAGVAMYVAPLNEITTRYQIGDQIEARYEPNNGSGGDFITVRWVKQVSSQAPA